MNSYHSATWYIAINERAKLPEALAKLKTVRLTANIFDKTPEEVAEKVIAERKHIAECQYCYADAVAEREL